MNKHLNQLLIAGTLLALVTCVGCEKKGPAQKAGEKVDEAVQKTGDAVKDAVDKAKQ